MKNKEKRFMELMGEYHIEIFADDFPNTIIFRNMNNDWLIWHNERNVFTSINYPLIWRVFENEYQIHDNIIKKFIKKMLLKYFKIKKCEPSCVISKHNTYLLEHDDKKIYSFQK